jgi:acyl carrier protein
MNQKKARPIEAAKLPSELTTIVANVLDRDPEEIPHNANLVDELEVDSVMRLEIMVTMERTYGVKFHQDDLPQIKSVDDMVKLLLSKAPA